MTKRIGIMTSGGDCPGLNAAIRAIVHRATITYGWQTFGIKNGTTGLIRRPLDYIELTAGNCDAALLRSGGTVLGSTNKDNPFFFPSLDGTKSDRSSDFYAGYKEMGLDALIAIGGDGSMKILKKLCDLGGLNLVTIPKTIDNDVAGTDYAIGYYTAVSVATEALDRLQPTAASHQRVMILEVMGRDAGHIALAAGVAGGADVILIPENPYSLNHIYNKINALSNVGRNFALIIVAEGVCKEDGSPVKVADPKTGRLRYGGIGQYLSEKISLATSAETRVTVLGHVQRGGEPCAEDRLLASKFGVAAVDLVNDQKFSRMVALQRNRITSVTIDEATSSHKLVRPESSLMRMARGLSISFGDE